MMEKKVKKAIPIKLPLKSFNRYLAENQNLPQDEVIKKAIYDKFGKFQGEMLISVNETEVNVKWYIPKIDSKAEFFHKKALGYIKEKDIKRAAASWQEAILLNDSDPDYYFMLSAVMLELKKYQESIDNLRQVVKICPLYPRVSLQLGTLYLKMKKFELAEKYIQMSLFSNPGLGQSYLNLGYIYSIVNKHEQGIKAYLKAQKLLSNDARVYMGLAKIYSKRGDIEKANSNFYKVIEFDKTQQLADYAKSAIKKTIETKKPDTRPPAPIQAPVPASAPESSQVVNIKIDPNANPDELFSKGYVCYLSGNYIKAEELYHQYLQLKPKDGNVWCVLGEVSMRTGKSGQAVKAFKKAISIEDKALYYKELAIALDAMNETTECLSVVKKAIELGKNDSVVYFLGGKSLAQMGQFQEARQMLEESVKLHRNNYAAQYELAVVLSQLKEFKVAKEHLKIIKSVKMDLPLKEMADELLNDIS